MDAVLALLFIAALIAGPLGVLAVRDRRRESAEAVLADIRAAVRRRLRGESLLSVQVVPATLTRPGRVVLSTPTGYEYLTKAVWTTVAGRVPAGYELVVTRPSPVAPEQSDRALPRAPQRALVLDDPDLRDVNQLSHTCPPRSSALRDDALERRVLLGVSASHEHVPGLEHALLRWVEDMALRRPLAQGKHDHAGPFLELQLAQRLAHHCGADRDLLDARRARLPEHRVEEIHDVRAHHRGRQTQGADRGHGDDRAGARFEELRARVVRDRPRHDPHRRVQLVRRHEREEVVLVRGHARDEPVCYLDPGPVEHVARGRVPDDVEHPLAELPDRFLLRRIDLDADEGPARPEQLPRDVSPRLPAAADDDVVPQRCDLSLHPSLLP